MEPRDKGIQSELDSFRAQWRAEVSARARPPVGTSSRAQQPHNAYTGSTPAPPPAHAASVHKPSHRKTPSRTLVHLEDEDEYVQSLSFDEPAPSRNILDDHATGSSQNQEPETALEFYEKAVDKETSGSLGDSLHLYRKAFRMDSRVDHEYKQKHFAAAWKMKPLPAPAQDATTSTASSKSPTAAVTTKSTKGPKQIPEDTNPSNAPVTVPNTAHHSLDGPALSMSELIGSFANITLEPAPPEIGGVAPPPCPIADVPGEILVHILRDVAITDVGDFIRLSRVCKRFAYLVATEDQIWRRICIGTEFGFGGMHYHWQQDHHWQPLPLQVLAAQGPDSPESPSSISGEGEDDGRVEDQVWTASELADRRAASSYATTMALVHSPIYAGSWQRMFRRRPRVRFNGCYISTVNYIRAGQASGHHITWNSPVHIVTYYRYLRLFRDGTAISLLTTDEPAAVVHHLTKENLLQHADRSTGMHLPSAFMSHALKGRWRLSSALDNVGDNYPAGGGGDDGGATTTATTGEGELYVETEGVGKKYMYRMELSVKGAGKKAIGNNKLQWKRYWSYNTLTDDWAEFGLKNDKAFFFSRVKSYGFGL